MRYDDKFDEDYEELLKTVPWQRPMDRGRTPRENRAAVAKVDQLVRLTQCTKTEAFCQVGLNFNTYYKIKRADGNPPTPSDLVPQIRAANNCGGPGKPKGYKVTIGTTGVKDTPIRRVQEHLSVIQESVDALKKLGLNLELSIN